MNKKNWDDIRYVLAVAESGSLNAAAKALGVTHVTVMRRVAAFEESFGQKVFIKHAGGYRVAPEAERILAVARNVEDAVLSVERTIHGTQEQVVGSIKIASTDTICQKLLPKLVTRMSQVYPKLTLTLLSANTYHDLARLAADIAIRPTVSLEDGLSGVVAGDLRFRVYGADPEPESWIGMRGGLSRSKPAEWMARNVSKEQIVHEADSFLVLQEMAAEGVGKTFLPSFLGDGDARLNEVNPGPVKLSVPVWIASQEEIFENSRFRAVREILTVELASALETPR